MPYRSTPRTRARRDERRESLLAAAERLVAAEGFGGASVAAIAAAAGMSTGAVYSHFPGKSQLLAAVFRRAADRELSAVGNAVAAAAPDAASRLSALVEAFAMRALHGRRMAWALLAEPVDPAVDAERLVYRRAYRQIAEEIVEKGVADSDLPPQDVALSAAALIGAVGEALVGPLSPVGAHTGPEDLLPPLQALCLRTVGVNPARHPNRV